MRACVHILPVWDSIWRLEEVFGNPGTEVPSSFEPPDLGARNRNPGPLEEQLFKFSYDSS